MYFTNNIIRNYIAGKALRHVVVALVLLSGIPLLAAERTFSGTGYWTDSECWGGESNIPVSGDTAVIRYASKCTIPSGVTLENITIQVTKDSTQGAATVTVQTGATLKNCKIVGSRYANISDDAKPRFVLDGGEIVYDTSMVGIEVSTNFVVEVRSGSITDNVKGNQRACLTVNNGGRFIQSNGTVSVRNLVINPPYGRFDLEGGSLSVINTLTIAPSYAWQAFADKPPYSLVLTGGTFSPTRVNGEGGRIRIERGVEIPNAVNWQLPQNANDEVYLESYGCTNILRASEFALGDGGNELRHDYTGRWDIVSCQYKLGSQFRMANWTKTNSASFLSVTDSRIWHSSNLFVGRDRVAQGGASTVALTNSTLLVGGDEQQYTLDEIFDAFTPQNVVSWPSYGLTVGYKGFLSIKDSTVMATDRLYLMPKSHIVIDNGNLWTKRLNSCAPSSDSGTFCREPCVIEFKGGTWTVAQNTVQFGRVFNAPDYATGLRHRNMFPIYIKQTGGAFSAGGSYVEMGGYSTNGVVRWEMSGGSLAHNTIFLALTNRVMEVARKGSLASGLLAGFEIRAGAQNDWLMEFILDSTAGHISPWVFTDGNSSIMSGNLRVRLDGGVLVSSRETFTLLHADRFWKGPNVLKYHGSLILKNNGTAKPERFRSLPDTSLWSTSLTDENCKFNVTLADPIATSAYNGGNLDLSTAPKAMGSVTLSDVSKNNLKEWEVRMRLRAADGSVMSESAKAAIVNGFVEAGYTNSVVEADGDYDVRLVVPPTAIPETARRFVWDFTRTESARTPDCVTTNALVSAISFRKAYLVKGSLLVIR